jgi:hypothetical protein
LLLPDPPTTWLGRRERAIEQVREELIGGGGEYRVGLGPPDRNVRIGPKIINERRVLSGGRSEPDFVLDTIGNHARRAVRDSCTIGRWADDVGAGANFGTGREGAGALASDHVSSSILESRKTWCYKET